MEHQSNNKGSPEERHTTNNGPVREFLHQICYRWLMRGIVVLGSPNLGKFSGMKRRTSPPRIVVFWSSVCDPGLSNRSLCRACKTKESSQEGMRCDLGGFNRHAPLWHLTNSQCFPKDLKKESTDPTVHIHGSSPREEQHIAKRHHFKAYSHLVEGVLACVIVSTMAGGRPLNSSSSNSGT